MNRIEPFTPSEVCLYFYLLSQWNENRSENTFKLGTKIIEKEVNITRMTICAARESLQERGLITYTKGDRRLSSPTYCIIEHVEVSRQRKTVKAKAQTGEIEYDEISIPPEFISPPEPEANDWEMMVPEVVEDDEKKPESERKPAVVRKGVSGDLFKPEKPPKREKKEFVPPTLQEVEDYFKGLGVVDAETRAQQFFFHYDSLGWHTATGAVVHRWDSLANKWILNDKRKEYENNRSSSKKGGEGDGYKQTIISRLEEAERKFREENGIV